MGFRNLMECVISLEHTGQLVRVASPIDPCLEMAEIQRRLYRRGGPAVLFTQPKGCSFPMLANLFGTIERTRFLFRDALADVRKLVELKTDPGAVARRPWRYWKLPFLGWRLRPNFMRTGPILAHETTVSKLPQFKSWPL